MVAPSDRRTVPARRTAPAWQVSPIPIWRSSPNIAAPIREADTASDEDASQAAWRAVRTPNTWVCNRHRCANPRRSAATVPG
jgi:hypothetical protein